MKIIIKLKLIQIKFFEIFLDKFKKRYLSFFIYEKLREKYTEIKILNKKVRFFTPSLYVYNRVNIYPYMNSNTNLDKKLCN